MRRIKHATDKGETEIELLNQPYNIKSNLNKEKIYWFTFVHISLTNSQTHKTLKQNNFKISKAPYKNFQ